MVLWDEILFSKSLHLRQIQLQEVVVKDPEPPGPFEFDI